MCKLPDWGFIDHTATNRTRFFFFRYLCCRCYTLHLPSKLVGHFTHLQYTAAARKARISAVLHHLSLFWRCVHTELLIHLGQVVEISISERTLAFQNGWVVWRTFQIFRNSKLLSSDYQHIKMRDNCNFPLFLKCISLHSFLLYTLEKLTENK